MRQENFILRMLLCIGCTGRIYSCSSDQHEVSDDLAQLEKVNLIKNNYVIDQEKAIELGSQFLDELVGTEAKNNKCILKFI